MIDDIFEAEGDVFDLPNVNRGLLILERNGETEKGRVKYQYIDDSTLIDYKDLIFYSPVWISISQYTAVSKLSSILPTIDKMVWYML